MIHLLTKIKKRLEKNLFAGISVIQNDEKLVLLIEELEEYSLNSKVVKKLHDILEIITKSEQVKYSDLLDSIALIDAIMMTNIKNEVNTNAKKVIMLEEPTISQVSLKTITELTNCVYYRKVGRFDLLKRTLGDDEIYDFRIIELLIYGLLDEYSLISNFCEKKLLEKRNDYIISRLVNLPKIYL